MNSNTYICWSEKFEPYTPKFRSKPSNPQTVYASNAREAAESYARIMYGFYDEKFNYIDVFVKESNNHYAQTFHFDVKVVIEPRFYAELEQ